MPFVKNPWERVSNGAKERGPLGIFFPFISNRNVRLAISGLAQAVKVSFGIRWLSNFKVPVFV